MSVVDLKARATQAVEDLRDELISVSLEIHRNPELGFKEFKAQSLLCGFLEKQGFLVERNVAGMETDFRATFESGKGGPTVAILAEYDALPEVGHACGHNIIGTSAVGAGAALKKALENSGVPGRVLVLGTPAEEGGGGKVLMVNAGVFEGVDCALMVHPTAGLSRIGGKSLATHSFLIDFHGKPAHAAGSPTEGINALDAVNIFFHAVACLRQHVPDDVRMHGMITKGGDAVNIIPEHTQVRYLARSFSMKTLEKLVNRIKDCAQAAALATGCKVTIEDKSGYKARIVNQPLADAYLANLRALGEEVTDQIYPSGGSTDFGDASLAVPACNAYIGIAPSGTASHSREFCEASASPRGNEALIVSAKSLAHTALDFLTDANLRERARDAFLKARES